jgi:hypothetical protein
MKVRGPGLCRPRQRNLLITAAASPGISFIFSSCCNLSLAEACFWIAPADFQLGSEQDRREARIKATCLFYSAVP